MPFTLPQQKALAIAPKVTGPMSILGSLCIIRSVRVDMKNNEAGTYHRLLLGLSAFDVVASTANSLSTWPIPKGTPGVWGASGNTKTCTFQGFMMHFVGAGALYNAAIAIYFLLRAKYNWNNKQIRRVEPFMHGIPIVYTLGTALVSLPLKLFNNANLWCWIAPLPLNCKDTFRFGEEGNCIRGDNAWIFRLAFLFVHVWISILVAMGCMISVYCTVLRHERAIDRVQEEGVSIRTQSKRVANQSFLYMMAFYLVWVPPSTLRLLQTIPGTTVKVSFPLIFFFALVAPMQGLFNFLIFYRARLMKYRRDYPQTSRGVALLNVVLNSTKLGSEVSEIQQTTTDKVFKAAKKESAVAAKHAQAGENPKR